MQRKTITAAAVAVALTAAGCGSATTSTTTTKTVAAKAAKVATPVKAPVKAAGLYTDMTVLGLDVQTTYNTKYRDGGPRATDTSCISTGTQTAECNATFADGTSQSIGITISADGNSWISHS